MKFVVFCLYCSLLIIMIILPLSAFTATRMFWVNLFICFIICWYHFVLYICFVWVCGDTVRLRMRDNHSPPALTGLLHVTRGSASYTHRNVRQWVSRLWREAECCSVAGMVCWLEVRLEQLGSVQGATSVILSCADRPVDHGDCGSWCEHSCRAECHWEACCAERSSARSMRHRGQAARHSLYLLYVSASTISSASVEWITTAWTALFYTDFCWPACSAID
jgi:hypothetical protein